MPRLLEPRAHFSQPSEDDGIAARLESAMVTFEPIFIRNQHSNPSSVHIDSIAFAVVDSLYNPNYHVINESSRLTDFVITGISDSTFKFPLSQARSILPRSSVIYFTFAPISTFSKLSFGE
jgi:hypothetical protein